MLFLFFLKQYENLENEVLKSFSERKAELSNKSADNAILKDWLLNEINKRKDKVLSGDIVSMLPIYSSLRIDNPIFDEENKIIGGEITKYIYKPTNKFSNIRVQPYMEVSNNNISGLMILNEDLSNSNFSNSKLKNAILTECLLCNVDFSNSNLSGTIFGKTDCRGADFSNSNLQGAIFSGDDLTNTNLENADFSHVIFDNSLGEKTKLDIIWKNIILNYNISGQEFIEWIQ